MAGKTFPKVIDTGMWDTYKENLKYAIKMLEENNIIGLIEPISEFGIPDYFLNSFIKGTIYSNFTYFKQPSQIVY